jgi:phage recombination protein Bet
MTAIALSEGGSRALTLSEDELIPVLQASLYPGAKPESIKLVLGYCRAAGLDPMQKPVHLVPMNVKKPGSRDEYEWRDVVMPGIGLYRVQAARTGELAGIDEPVFGEMLKQFGVEYPDWCKVTVYRMIGGQRVAFTACEFWVENYATQKRDSEAPNAMWKRRPRGQLAKCAEAQALRKAFPELGAQPTADETIVEPSDVIDIQHAAQPAPAVGRKSKPAPDVIDVTQDEPQPQAPAQEAEALEKMVGEGEIAFLTKKAKAVGADLPTILANFGGLVAEPGKMSKTAFDRVRAELIAMGA